MALQCRAYNYLLNRQSLLCVHMCMLKPHSLNEIDFFNLGEQVKNKLLDWIVYVQTFNIY